MKNNCGFGVAVWHCTEGGGSFQCDKRKHFPALKHIASGKNEAADAFAEDSKYELEWVACGASSKSRWKWSIANNKKNAKKFGCKIFERK